KRRSVTDTGAGRSARGRAEEAWEDVRVLPLRRRGPRVLLLQPARVPRGAGGGWLGEGLRVLREAPFVRSARCARTSRRQRRSPAARRAAKAGAASMRRRSATTTRRTHGSSTPCDSTSG